MKDYPYFLSDIKVDNGWISIYDVTFINENCRNISFVFTNEIEKKSLKRVAKKVPHDTYDLWRIQFNCKDIIFKMS